MTDTLRRPAPIGGPVLDSVLPVVERSRHVRTDVAKIVQHARWMACEELPWPAFSLPFEPDAPRNEVIDFVLTANCINTAFTDLATGVRFQVEYGGRRWSDALALFACWKRALDEERSVLDGGFLARLTREELGGILRGNIEMPMLDEKLQALNEVGRTLAARYGGAFHAFVRDCSPRLYDNGNGLVDRLVREFPRFDDVSTYRGHEVRFYKLAQLGYWILYADLKSRGGFRIDDVGSMTAFADYIVPVALRVMDILVCSAALERKIEAGVPIARDSDEEIEIRAHTIYATALLCEEINASRPADLRVIIPQVDARLWSAYHLTHRSHHLTRTTMY
jgi:hypothetical protein